MFPQKGAPQDFQSSNVLVLISHEKHQNTKCHTFSETSCDPLSGLQLICRYFANFLQILFCTPKVYRLLYILLPSVIPFWKPLLTLLQDQNSFADFLQSFCKLYITLQKYTDL